MRSFVLSILVVAACGKGQEPPERSTGSPNAPTESAPRPKTAGATDKARALFDNTCSQCHGPNGRGDGPAAQMMNPKPRDYTDAAWQASVSDDDIKAIITKGGQAVGKSPSMPAFGPKLRGDTETLDALVALIRSFGKK